MEATSIFHMLIRWGRQAKKLTINGGTYMNVVSESIVEHLKLPTEPHPRPYKLAWIYNTTILITERCLVSYSTSAYKDSIWCDVIL